MARRHARPCMRLRTACPHPQPPHRQHRRRAVQWVASCTQAGRVASCPICRRPLHTPHLSDFHVDDATVDAVLDVAAAHAPSDALRQAEAGLCALDRAQVAAAAAIANPSRSQVGETTVHISAGPAGQHTRQGAACDTAHVSMRLADTLTEVATARHEVFVHSVATLDAHARHCVAALAAVDVQGGFKHHPRCYLLKRRRGAQEHTCAEELQTATRRGKPLRAATQQGLVWRPQCGACIARDCHAANADSDDVSKRASSPSASSL